MKTSRLIVFGASLAAALSFSGCDTFDSRAKEKSEVFNALPENTQKRLERGVIHVGDTQDMVYISLGDPDEKRDRRDAKRTEQTWIYRTYWEQYEGNAWVGWRRVIVPAGNGRDFIVYHEPITRDVYRQRSQENIRVTFANEKVTSVEQNKT